MSKSFRSSLALSVFWCLHSAAVAQPAPYKAELKVTVRVYNYARVPSNLLARGTDEAARVFRQIGVETVWQDCALTAAEIEGNPVCGQPTDTVRLALRILPRSMAERLPSHPKTFGFAQLDADGESGSDASVFFHRVTELAHAKIATRAVVLGHVLAHEIGHLLLGAGRHSRSGIMRASWRQKDLEHAARGNLVFTPPQAQRIRAQVLARTHNQETPGRSHCGILPRLALADCPRVVLLQPLRCRLVQTAPPPVAGATLTKRATTRPFAVSLS